MGIPRDRRGKGYPDRDSPVASVQRQEKARYIPESTRAFQKEGGLNTGKKVAMHQSHNAQGTSRTFSLPSPETDSYRREMSMNTITKHYIDGAFVESHGREVMEIINPTNRTVIAQVTLGDEDDARRAIAAAKRAFAMYGRSTKEERAKILRRLHEVVSARIDDLTAAMVEEYGGPAGFSRVIVEAGGNVVPAAAKAPQEPPPTRSR